MEKKQAGSLLQIRIDERLRYLTNLAVAATGKTLTQFVSDAMIAAFDGVSLYKRPQERVYGENSQQWPELYDPAEDAIQREAMILGKQADLLWSDSEITRFEMLDLIAKHLLSEDDKALLAFVRSLDEYKIKSASGFRLDRTKIDADWDVICQRFEKSKKGKK